MSYPVKWFHSDMQGAPTLNATAGSLIALLDACLINGFSLLTVDSLTYDSETGEVTATVSGGHGFSLHQVVTVGGADQAAYNGEQRITYADSTTFRYTPASAPAATPATTTASLSAKVSPVGSWEKAFDDGAGTKAAYRSTKPESTGLLLRLDDTNTVNSWNYWRAMTEIKLVETMTDIGTFTATWSGWWAKGQSGSDSGANSWVLVADGSLLYVFTRSYTGDGNLPTAGFFGDFTSFKAGDAYNAAIGANIDVQFSSAATNTGYFGQLRADPYNAKRIARSFSQLSGTSGFSLHGSDVSSVLGGGGIAYPNAADNGIYFAPLYVHDDYSLRGRMPGLYQLLHKTPLPHLGILADVPAYPGRRFLAVQFNAGTTFRDADDYPGEALFDITGPWR